MIRDDKEQLTETDEPKTSDVVLHDTAGWRSLESYMLLLQEIMTAFVESWSNFYFAPNHSFNIQAFIT